jgi:hypothetical protein
MYVPDITQEYPIADPSDAAEAFETANVAVYQHFNIETPIHIWENGYEQGDATDQDINALITRLNVPDREALWSLLNRVFERQYRFLLLEKSA